MMFAAEIQHLLKQAMGLDAASIGLPTIERAVQDRQVGCGIADTWNYVERLRASKAEMQELIESVVVPETWFFRDPGAFDALARMAIEQWLPNNPHGVLNLLSLPCASGEEPYSMAMALLDAGLPPGRFRIDAVDISTRALDLARRAVYGKNSFRSDNLEFRDRHFQLTANGYRPSEVVIGSVRFMQANLLAANFMSGAGLYDAIFCRNVLIYFDRRTQDHAITMLRRLLKEQGMLCVAPSETGLLSRADFVSARVPMAFAFFRSAPDEHSASAPVRPFSRLGAPPARRAAIFDFPSLGPLKRATPLPAPSMRTSSLEEATRLADQGHLVDAAKLCEDHLRTAGPSAEALHLMGLIRNAAGNLASAVDFFRKALYLNPNYHDALVHLASALENQGDADAARTLRARLRRLQLKG